MSVGRLPNQVWNQGHEARALDSVRELALVPATDAGALARHDLTEGGQVTAERVRILVVNLLDVHLAEETLSIDFLFHRCGEQWARISRSLLGMLISYSNGS